MKEELKNLVASDKSDLKEFLKENNLLSTDKEIFVQNISIWIEDNIIRTDLDLYGRSPYKILTEKTGDCSDISILTLSLLRAGGIPSSKVRAVFGYYKIWPVRLNLGIYNSHMWVLYKRNLDNKWVPIDLDNPDEEVRHGHPNSKKSVEEYDAYIDNIYYWFNDEDFEILKTPDKIIPEKLYFKYYYEYKPYKK